MHRVRAAPLPEDCPNWVLTHTLLPFAPARSLTPEESAEFRRRLGRLLRLAGPDGRGGCLALYRGKPEVFNQGRLFDRQHHPAQFLHYFAMTEVPLGTPLNVPGHSWTVEDLYRGWLRTARLTGDLSWATSVVCEYQPPGRPWTDPFGRPGALGDFVRALRKAPEPYCDQSHWMTALARLLADRRWRSDPSMAGEWPALEGPVASKLRDLRSGQKADGSLAIAPEALEADYRVTRPGGAGEVTIHYTGHHLEWFTIALTPEQLREEWVLRAVGRVADAINARYPGGEYFPRFETEEECFTAGFLAHAVSGLSRWHDKVTRPDP